MDEFLRSCISIPFWTSDYGFRECQQAGTDLQIRALCRIQVDIEADLVVPQKEADHPAHLHKAFRLSHGQHWTPFEVRQRRGDGLPLRLWTRLPSYGKECTFGTESW